MYNQSIHNIKLAIIPLDGIILDLNRFRYNYYHHLCESKKVPLEKRDFYLQLSNMYDMYNNLPLSHAMDVGPFNARVERELFQYLSYKGVQVKEGCLELIEYFHQKDIPIAIISTHRTKDAVEYLKLANLYHQVHYIIGSDTMSFPLPSTQILETITQHFSVANEEVLVLSPFLSLNKAAYQLHMNIIYCEDLVSAQEEEIQTSFKVVDNLYDALNIIIFDKYEDAELYSPILGMNSDMSQEELDDIKDKLESTYYGDEKILDLVEKTYSYHISQLTDSQNEKKKTNVQAKKFRFSDEMTNEFLLTRSELKEEQASSKSTYVPHLNQKDEIELTQLLKQINQEKPKSKTKEVIKKEETFSTDEKELSSKLSILMNFVYISSLSFISIFCGLVFYVAFIHSFQNDSGIFRIIKLLFSLYYGIIETLFKFIFNCLHAIIPMIPNYNSYALHNTMFSHDGIVLLNIFLFQIFMTLLIKLIIDLIRGSKDENIHK
jgi:Predicted phosphatase/phosphohexomutase